MVAFKNTSCPAKNKPSQSYVDRKINKVIALKIGG